MDALLAIVTRRRRIVRVRLADGALQTVVRDTGRAPDGVVVSDGVVYWTTMGRPIVHGPAEADWDFSPVDGGLHAQALDGGGGVRDVIPTGGLTTGKQVTSDGAGALLFCDREGCRVGRVRTDGTGRADLVIRSGRGGVLDQCVGVAVTAEHVYWTQKGPAKGGRGRIFRAGLDLPDGEDPATRSDIELLWDGLAEPIDLHVEGDHLYWTDRGAAPDGNTLNRAPLPAPGARGAPPTILADGFREAIGLVVDARAHVAYVSDLAGDLRAVGLPERGAPLDRVVVSIGEPFTGLAALPARAGDHPR